MVQENPEYEPPAASVGMGEEVITDLSQLNTLYPPSVDYLGWLGVIKNPTFTALYQCRYNGATYSWVEILGGITALSYMGTWDALTNTPALVDGTGTAGEFYIVDTAGTQDLGSGPITFAVGDWVLYNGTVWQKVDHTDQVTSVFTRTGAITAQSGDYTHSQIGSVGPDDHHTEDHASRHLAAGADDLIAAGIESDIALNNLGEKNHASLASVTSDQHHAKSHAHDGVDGSGTVAHSDTTGQTVDDHHNRDHASTHLSGGADDLVAAGLEADLALNNLGEKDHASLANVSSDQHHAQAHAHDGVDGSGTVDHDDITNVSANQHHAQLHSASHSSGGGDQVNHDDLGNISGGAPADFQHLTSAEVTEILISQSNIVYFGKHGNDSNDGENINRAVLTITQAIVRAVNMSPAVNNRIAIVCLDGGIYAETPSIPQYIDFCAPNATVTGGITITDDVRLLVNRIISGGTGIFKNTGSGNALAKVDEIIAGPNGGVLLANGSLDIEFGLITITTGYGFGSASTGELHSKGNHITITGVNGIAFGAIVAGAKLVCNINDIQGANGTGLYIRNGAEIYGLVNHLDCLVPYNVGAGCHLDLISSRIEGGTPINSGTAHIIDAHAQNQIMQFIDAAGGLVLTNVAQPIDWDTEDIKDSFFTHSTTVNPSEITIAEAGLYKLSVMITVEVIDNTGGLRGNPRLHIDIDTGGGWVQQPDNMGGYTRENLGGGLACSITGIGYFYFNAGDKFRITTLDSVATEPNEQTVAYSQRLLVKYVRRFK